MPRGAARRFAMVGKVKTFRVEFYGDGRTHVEEARTNLKKWAVEWARAIATERDWRVLRVWNTETGR